MMKNYIKLRDDGNVTNYYVSNATGYSNLYDLQTLTFSDLPWGRSVEEDCKEIINILRRHNIKKFNISYSGTSLKNTLILLMSMGVKIVGGEDIVVKDPYGFDRNEIISVLKCEVM